LFLLFHGKQWVLANLRGNIANAVGILDSDEALMGSSQLGVVVRSENFIHSLLAEKVVVQIVRVLVSARRWSGVHPF
jgi:hypothetical protein